MSKQQILTISTLLSLDGKPIGDGKPFTKHIPVDSAFATTVTVSLNAPGCKKCFRVEAGLKTLLKFLLLKPDFTPPDPQPKPDPTQAAKPDPAAKPTIDQVLKDGGLQFYTSDPIAGTEPIDLTGTQLYTDDQLDLLFGVDPKTGDEQKELEKITFINHTGYSIDITIIQGRDFAPCDEDDAECPYPTGAAKKS
jgi:hypothetical protein